MSIFLLALVEPILPGGPNFNTTCSPHRHSARLSQKVELQMAKTTYSSKDGWITGKQVTTKRSDGSSETMNYKAGGKKGSLSRTILGPSYTATSKTSRDKKGNTRTKSYR
jgi:hypothetical protein